MALPHSPLTTTPLEPKASQKHKAMVRYIDHLTGKLVKHLDSLDLRKKTIIVWTTDNGTSGGISNQCNGRMVKGGKMKTTENGVNAPFIVSCPGLVPEGVVSDALVDFTDMLPTFADLAGGKPEDGHTYDGVSLKDVFLGKEKESTRKYILAMGSIPGRVTDKGVENVYYFRDRVLREARYKLFVGSNRKPKKLVDVIKDPDEKVNLINKPEHKDVLERLVAAVQDLPKKDNDPDYVPLEPQKWDRKGKYKSQVHKVGHPDNPGGKNDTSKPHKKRKKVKEQ